MEDTDRRFDRPVKILTGRGFTVSRQVETTVEAATYLLDDKWPSAGKKHLAARKACLAVLDGLKEARAARKAFEAAADEAGILVTQSGLPQGPGRRDKRKADAG